MEKHPLEKNMKFLCYHISYIQWMRMAKMYLKVKAKIISHLEMNIRWSFHFVICKISFEKTQIELTTKEKIIYISL